MIAKFMKKETKKQPKSYFSFSNIIQLEESILELDSNSNSNNIKINLPQQFLVFPIYIQFLTLLSCC